MLTHQGSGDSGGPPAAEPATAAADGTQGRPRVKIRAAAAGLLAAGTGLAVAEFTALWVRPEAAPLVSVGGAVIDATPTPLKEFAVRTVGENDKPLLLLGIGLVVAAIAAIGGVLAIKRPALGPTVVGGLAVIGGVVASFRPGAGPLDAIPSLVGAAVSAYAVLWLSTGETGPDAALRSTRMGFARRKLLRDAAVVGGLAVVAGGTAAGVRTYRTRDAERARDSVALPVPADPAPARPAGLGPDFITANADFYRVDVALTVPRVDPRSYELRIGGMVDRPRTFTLDELLKRPMIERDITLNCVSNEVGGPYVGTARWLGVSLATLLREAGIRSGADQVVAKGADEMTIGTPVEVILDGRDALLCVGMNGEPLPAEHGFPVRMLTPGLYGYVGAAKWLLDLEVTRFDTFDPYWVRRDWAAEAPVKIASRIDRPAPFARFKPGEAVRIAGVAWAQRRGIDAVEVQVDDGPWLPAALTPTVSTDTWTQWSYTWTAEPGSHTLKARATDGTGAVQDGRRVTPFPDGATGWHTVSVTVS